MGTVRKQSIISTLIIYIGFLIGFVNVYFFTRQGTFTEGEYGLTVIFMAIGSFMFAFSNMGMTSVVYKFSPYYRGHLTTAKNDILTWALLVCIAGFAVVVGGAFLFKDLVIRKFQGNSPLLVEYYYWIIPFGFGLMLFSLLEAYAWSIHKSIVTNLLRETVFKLLTTVLIVLFIAGIIPSFDLFIKFYSFFFVLIAIALAIHLHAIGQLPLYFGVSKVTRRFRKKMATLAAFVYTGILILVSAQYIDSIIIAALKGQSALEVFALGALIASIVQVPQRSIVSATVGVLSESWKAKDFVTIERLYKRSSVNLLLAGLALFCIIWLNFTDAVTTIGLKEKYLDAQWIFFLLGIAKLIDLGTGVNGQIISTSTYWRFEFISGALLLLLMVPLNYFLVKSIGITGAGISSIISFSIYNGIRIFFLYRKFQLQPFSVHTPLAIIIAGVCYWITWYLFKDSSGWVALILRSMVFFILFGALVFRLELTPDVMQLYHNLKHRLARRKR